MFYNDTPTSESYSIKLHQLIALVVTTQFQKKAGGSYEQKDVIFYNNQFIHNNNFINYFTI